jgi:hypothetical protein
MVKLFKRPAFSLVAPGSNRLGQPPRFPCATANATCRMDRTLRRRNISPGIGIIDVPDLDTALEWAARHPAAAHSRIEIRPLLGSHFTVGTAKAS